jgi:long-chain acyl-CoA synthetase
MLPNRVELLLGLMAAWRLGAAATPINPVFTANEAGYQLQNSGAVLLLTSNPDTFLGAIEGHRATYFSAVPTIYARLAELPEQELRDTSSVRFAVCGAAPVSKELLQRSESRFGFPIVEGYGLTEGTCASTCNPIDGVRKVGTVGPALPGQQVATMGPDGSLLPVGAAGEVVIKGGNVMRGYLNRPEATAETIVARARQRAAIS